MSVINITVTGGAGRISYSLIPLILTGQIFGDRPISLRLLDVPQCEQKLHGVKLEIDDSNYSLLHELICTTNPEEAFKNAEVAILIGGFPRLPGMERKDLLLKNAENIRSQAQALNSFASKNVKVLVVANPANTNCLVALKTATNIPPQNFTCLTRLDEERLRGFILQNARKQTDQAVTNKSLQNVFILGNHSTTQVAHIQQGTLTLDPNNQLIPISTYYTHEGEYEALLRKVQHRGAEIIQASQLSSALSAAQAIVKHLVDWIGVGSSQTTFSMGVYAQGNPYGITDELVFSFPCVRAEDVAGGYVIMDSLDFQHTTVAGLIKKTEEELLEEKGQIEEYLQ